MTDPRAWIEIALHDQFDPPSNQEPIAIVRLSVGNDITWDMLPYPASRRSLITRQALQDFTNRIGRPGIIERQTRLTNLQIDGQPVPNFEVSASLAPSRLGVDGFLGLDFFERFEIVEWRPRARLLRLLSM